MRTKSLLLLLSTLIWQKQPDDQWKLIVEKLDFGMLAKK
jgi:hypothetical protein